MRDVITTLQNPLVLQVSSGSRQVTSERKFHTVACNGSRALCSADHQIQSFVFVWFQALDPNNHLSHVLPADTPRITMSALPRKPWPTCKRNHRGGSQHAPKSINALPVSALLMDLY